MRRQEQMGYVVGLAIGNLMEGGGRLLRRAHRLVRAAGREMATR